MKLKVFAVRDVATAQFGNPMFLVSAGQVMRSFSDEVNRAAEDNMMYKHPGDYELYELGSFDTDLGTFDCHSPEQLTTGKTVAQKV